MVLLDTKGNFSSNERKKFIEQILSIILKEMIEQFNPFSSSDIKKMVITDIIFELIYQHFHKFEKKSVGNPEYDIRFGTIRYLL
jgi:hypothetical protein